MTEKTIFAGFGGQGVISLGQIWVSCGMKEGRRVSFFPFYGAEKRGGIARASCVVSDSEIASPIVSQADSAVVMNRDSLEPCAAALKEGALMIVNSSLLPLSEIPKAVAERFTIVPVAATEIADRMGNARIANMVMLGALAKKTKAVALTRLEEALQAFFPGAKSRFIPLNVEAVRAGMDSC